MFVRTTAINKLLRLKSRVRVIPGGTSAGKTFGIIPILIDMAARRGGLEISIVSESIPHLRRGAMKDFIKIMQWTGRYVDVRWNRTTFTYTFANGSYIEFFSVDQDSKLRGARRTHLYVNEANNITWESYHQMAIRTSEQIWIDFNPTSEFWAHTELTDAEWLTLTYMDNEALSDSIRLEIEKAKEKAKTSEYWANWWRVYGLGQTGNLQGVVFTDWKIGVLPEDAKLRCVGLDFGYTNDPTAIVALYEYDGSIWFDCSEYQTGLLNSDIARLLEKYGNIPVYADSSEPKSISEIRQRGINILSVIKGKDSILHGIDLIQQRSPFYVTQRSVDLIKELRGYLWEVDRFGKTTNVPKGTDHAIDAMRYAAMMWFSSTSKSIVKSYVI